MVQLCAAIYNSNWDIMRQKRQSLLDLASASPQHRGYRKVRSNAQNKVKIRSKVRATRPNHSENIANSGMNNGLVDRNVHNHSSRSARIEDDLRSTDQRHKTGKFGFFTRKDQANSPEKLAQSTPVDRVPEYNNSYEIDPDKPLLDLFIIVKHIWLKKWLIIVLGLIGAALGVFVALSTPHKYYADSRLILDPRDVQVTDTVNNNNQASSQVLLAVVDSQMQVARSTSVLERVVEKLRLDQDPEFNGDNNSGILSKIKSVLSSSSNSKDPYENAVAYLQKNMGLARDPETFLVYIGASTNNAEKSALVANTIVEEYLVEYSKQQSGIFSKTSNSIEIRLEELRKKLDAAEKAIVDYRSENDIIDVGGGVINEKEMLALSNELAKVRADQVAKSVIANELRNADVNGVISGSFPEAALSTTLAELRKQYTEAKSKSDSLAVGLGPRHPQYIAAKASADAVAVEIKNELTRIISSTQNDVLRARDSESQLAEKLAVLKTRASSQSTENVGLRELERKAEAIRQIYESLLRRARETTERGNLETSVIQVIAKADPPQQPSTTSRKTTVLLFGILGGMLGLAIAFILGSIESLKQHSVERRTAGEASHKQQRSFEDNRERRINRVDLEEHGLANTVQDYNRESSQIEPAHDFRAQMTNSTHGHDSNSHTPLPQQNLSPHQPVYPPQFNPVVMAPPYAAQSVMPNGYPMPQAQWQSPNIPYGYAPQMHAQSQQVHQAQANPQVFDPNNSANPVQSEQNVASVSTQQNEDRDKVMRLKSDVQRLRAELESWAQSRNQ